jgi:hypothetical protein
MNTEEIKKLAKDYSSGKSSAQVFKEAHEVDFIAGFNKCLGLNATTPFTPERTAKEEAERLVKLYARYLNDGHDISDAIKDQQNTITALKSRGIDASYEEEVLTILKGM